MIQRCFSDEFPEPAVAALFVIAGYLVYRKESPTWVVYRRKMRNRFRSLLVPYFVWNALAFAAQVVGQLVPATRPYFTRRTLDVTDLKLWDLIEAFVGIEDGAPIIGPLWFMKVLIILSLTSPVLWRACKMSRGLVLPALFVWYLVAPATHFLISYPVKSTFYYSVGLWLAQKRLDLDGRLPERIEWLILAAYPMVIAANVALWLRGFDILILRNLYTFYSVIFVWVLWSRLSPAVTGLFVSLAPVAFFLYAAHPILIQVVRKGLKSVYMPTSEISAIPMYALPPLLTIGVVLMFHRILQEVSPQTLSLLCGGRVR